MAPDWLTVIAWTYLSSCFACAAGIASDIAFSHRRQPMGVMNAVYPITALYLGPFALAFYWRWVVMATDVSPDANRDDHPILRIIARQRLACQARH